MCINLEYLWSIIFCANISVLLASIKKVYFRDNVICVKIRAEKDGLIQYCYACHISSSHKRNVYVTLSSLSMELYLSQTMCFSTDQHWEPGYVSSGKYCSFVYTSRHVIAQLHSSPTRPPVPFFSGLSVFLNSCSGWPSRAPIKAFIRICVRFCTAV